jgi:acetate kinase
MTYAVVTFNAGSSSVKFAVYEVSGDSPPQPRLVGKAAFGTDFATIDTRPAGLPAAQRAIAGADLNAVVSTVFEIVGENVARSSVRAVGHRIVHGGPDFAAPQVRTPEVVAVLERLTPLAPQHQPFGLRIAAAAAREWPAALQVAAFDTAFHRTTPRVEQLFALPRRYADEGVIRYGFHGLSYEYIASAAPALLGPSARRLIVAHLGHGCSLCAMLDGKSIATTMGFTALDGLPMATRSGAVDPGVLLHLLEERGLTVAALQRCLYEESGLLGVSGISGDIRTLEASSDPRAIEAIDFFAYRIAREIGALTAALGGLDALIFTAGIGENSRTVRALVLDRLNWMGFSQGDEPSSAPGRITRADARISAWVIPTDEEIMLARHAIKATSAESSRAPGVSVPDP